MRSSTRKIGDITEAVIMAELIKKGKQILLPFSDNCRYDIVLDEKGKFIRIQCKTGRIKDGAVLFRPYSSHSYKNGSSHKPYIGQADLFSVYCPDNDKIYVIPVKEVARKWCALRLVPARNGQKKGIKYAKDYEL